MRPVLKPGLRRLWRDSTTLQIGVDPLRAVILTGIGPAYRSALDTLEPPGPDLDPGGQARDPATRTMIEILAQAGLLDDDSDPGTAAGTGVPASAEVDHGRFAPDVAALSLASFGVRLPRSALWRRRRARVSVRGAGRIGAQIATLLTAAGVGQVVVDDPGSTAPADVAPGGLRLDDVGRPRSSATQAAMGRVGQLPGPTGRVPTPRSPRSARSPGAPGAPRASLVEPLRPDLVVLAPVGLPLIHPDECLRLERAGFPHLLAGVRETTGVVGPLVVPGSTSCLHCQHLHRDARDPDWPILAMQMVRPSERGADPCEISLATLVASIACMQALDLLDAAPPATGGSRPRLPATAEGTLEITRSDLRIRRRTWPPHPECPCRTARRAADPPPHANPVSPTGNAPSRDRRQPDTGSTR
ncbi:dinucleotide-utilizing enzyme [Frankia sp. EI5c]|uniref:ThiF family adenylyltransferase n=1 Tax=Frankia sp. EI5c TaxID=683316 RepID=UPI0007C2F8F2|nr:ThiF family adenylyltransferase [Frankia sp. EI5c]OAA24924.1 dinucleotide-utilizing enzyme [Frankia sp. EI5c]